MQVDCARRLRRRLLIYIAAGPAANLISVPIVGLAVNYVFVSQAESWWTSLAAEFVVFSMLVLLVSLMPFGARSSSDGSRIQMLLTSRPRARRWISKIALGGQHRRGVRPKRWRKTWLSAATALKDGALDEFSGNWLAYISANDEKNERLASAHLERCLELTGILRSSVRDLVANEASVFAAWFRDDLLLAEKWRAQVKRPKLRTPLGRIRSDIALDCARRDFDAALSAWEGGLRHIGKLRDQASRDRFAESWAEWKTEIQDRQSSLISA